METVRQQPLGRHFGARLHCAQILGKAAHHAQASGPLSRLAARGLGGPLQCQLGRDKRGLRFLGKAHELVQFVAGIPQLKAEAAA